MRSSRIPHHHRVGAMMCLLAFVFISSFLPAQQASQSPIFRAERNEVEVVVIVRDNQGNPVADLKAENFQILDNGKPQVIRSFAVQQAGLPAGVERTSSSSTATPLSVQPAAGQSRNFIALFFDDLNTPAGDFIRVQKAAAEFVANGLQREDRVGIFKASGNGEVPFTNDKDKLLATINGLRPRPTGTQKSAGACPRMTAYEAYLLSEDLDPEALEVLTDRTRDCICPPPAQECPGREALKSMAQTTARAEWFQGKTDSQNVLSALDAAIEALATLPGRRMLVLTSTGFLSGGLERDIHTIIDNALQEAIVINSLSARGLYAEALGSNQGAGARHAAYEAREVSSRMMAENTAMADFAASTGGKFYKTSNDLAAGFKELAAPDAAYLLAFSPDPLKHDGKFHKLKVVVKAPGKYTLQAREGYFAPTEKSLEAARTRVAEPKRDVPQPAAVTATTTATPPPAPPADAAKPAAEVNAVSPAPNAIAEAAPKPNQQPDPKLDSAEVATSRASEVEFLTAASREVDRYIKTFADLTADEDREMVTFSMNGQPNGKRETKSALVVYRLRTQPDAVIEYRDVISVDGREIKGHADRAAKMWQEIAKTRSSKEEVRLIWADSERYDVGMQETGFTLFEGLPLRSQCAGDFTFREIRRETVNGRPARVFEYHEVRPCNLIAYHFPLPSRFRTSPISHGGELSLDAETAEILREERNVYIGPKIRLAHITFEYGKSQFGILVPTTIVLETFGAEEAFNTQVTRFTLQARMVETYGPFSRFEVNVQQKTPEIAH